MKTLDGILGLHDDRLVAYWRSHSHKCFGRYMEAPDWNCETLIGSKLAGCIACRQFVEQYGRTGK